MGGHMATLSPKQVETEYGIDRNTLRNWESEGLISVTRTSGNHRRYDSAQIENVASEKQIAQESDAPLEVSYHEFGITGIKRAGGTILEERLKELRGYSGRILKREMRLNDPVLGAMFFGITAAMRKAEWRVVPASDNAADRKTSDFIDESLNDMSWDFHTQMTMIIEELLEQGFAVTETVYKRRYGENPRPYITNPAQSLYNDGRIGWRKWAIRPATSLQSGNEWILDDNDGIIGINQTIDEGFGKKWYIREIPIEKLLHFRTTPHPSNSPEGREIHRAAYPSWWRKTNLEEIEAIGIERDLGGIPVVYLGKGTTKSNDPNSDFMLSQDLVVNLRNDDQMGVVFPHQKLDNDGNGILLELLSSDSRRSHDTDKIIMRYNKLIAMTTLAQFLFLGMEGVGSYALAKWQGDLFSLAISAYLDNIASVINKYAIPKLIRFNGIKVPNGYPKLTPGVVGIPDLEAFGNFVNSMVNARVITVDDKFENRIRQVAGLPQMSTEIMGQDRQPVQLSMFGNNEGGGNSTDQDDDDDENSTTNNDGED